MLKICVITIVFLGVHTVHKNQRERGNCSLGVHGGQEKAELHVRLF